MNRLWLVGPAALAALVLCTAGKSGPDHSTHDKTPVSHHSSGPAKPSDDHPTSASPACPPSSVPQTPAPETSGPSSPPSPGPTTGSTEKAGPPVPANPSTPPPVVVAAPIVATTPETSGTGAGVQIEQAPELATTGSRTEQAASVGGGLLGAGLGLMWLARRRKAARA